MCKYGVDLHLIIFFKKLINKVLVTEFKISTESKFIAKNVNSKKSRI